VHYHLLELLPTQALPLAFPHYSLLPALFAFALNWVLLLHHGAV